MRVELKSPPRLCDSCLASKGQHCPVPLNYRNFGDEACWQHTAIDHRTYVAMTDSVSPWAVVPGWRIETCSFDWLHNVYLGVGRDVVASGIWLFIRQGMYDHLNLDDMDDLLGHIHMDIVATCKQHGFFGQYFNIYVASPQQIWT